VATVLALECGSRARVTQAGGRSNGASRSDAGI
jgi:hypothetical protein